jgi:outer membrane protein assembly factor BamB
MTEVRFMPLAPIIRARAATILIAIVSCTLAGCAFFDSSSRPKPAELQPVSGFVLAKQAWISRIGAVTFPLEVAQVAGVLHVASTDGSVAAIDARTGADVWRTNVGGDIAAGVGSDGKTTAVVTAANDVVALLNGREIWREKLSAAVYTPPLVAGGRVFVLAADRSTYAFDGQTGKKLWSQQRPTEPLVLRQAGVMLAVGDTLVVGLAGRLAGLNPGNGSARWEVAIASPRGINDVERLVDLVGGVSRDGEVVCARAFQANVGCVNTSRGNLLWTVPANGGQGVRGDDKFLFGTESDGSVQAWSRADGQRAWKSEALRYRGLTTPLVVGRSIAIGDATGIVHLLSRNDGELLNRISTDGSAIAAAPALVGNTLIAVTRNGGVYGFVPE